MTDSPSENDAVGPYPKPGEFLGPALTPAEVLPPDELLTPAEVLPPDELLTPAEVLPPGEDLLPAAEATPTAKFTAADEDVPTTATPSRELALRASAPPPATRRSSVVMRRLRARVPQLTGTAVAVAVPMATVGTALAVHIARDWRRRSAVGSQTPTGSAAAAAAVELPVVTVRYLVHHRVDIVSHVVHHTARYAADDPGEQG